MKWDEGEPTGGEIVKLAVGESIEGILIAKNQTTPWKNRFVYRIKLFDSDKIKILTGTTRLDESMSEKEVGQPIKIERIEDTPSGKEHPYHNFKIYSAKE